MTRFQVFLLMVFTSAPTFATDFAHDLKAIKFLPNSQFAFKTVETMCLCKADKCLVSDESGDNRCLPEELAVIDLKSDKGVKVSAELKKSLSETKSFLERKEFPLQYNGDTFTTALDVDCNREDESYAVVGDDPIPKNRKKPNEKCNVYLVSKRNGRKKITTIQRGFSPQHYIGVSGYYLSPDEPRVAIVVRQSETQFEESSTSYESVHGADLGKGYKK